MTEADRIISRGEGNPLRKKRSALKNPVMKDKMKLDAHKQTESCKENGHGN